MKFLHLPFDVQQSVLAACLSENASMSRCSRRINEVSIPLLYYRIELTSATQLVKFIDETSGSERHCPSHTYASLIVEVPGVPGPLYGAGPGDETHGTMIKAAKAISKCPNIRDLSLRFYSVSHSVFSTSSRFRETELTLFRNGLSSLNSLKSFSWSPPGLQGNEKVQGISIAVVKEYLPSLVKGLEVSCPDLESFRMRNVMFDEDDGGLDLFTMLSRKSKLRKFSLETATGVNPRGVATLALSGLEARQEFEIKISDGFLDSIWGPRLLAKDLREALRSLLGEGGEVGSRDEDLKVEKALASVRLFEIPGGVGGMF